jgi:hypothetical protein
MLVRNLTVAAGHHNESDGSEQARKTANDYDDKHDSPPTMECSGPIAR